mmetsp:Transcript_27343/g.49197  ORF Transcript_27343/g.49197 Transcript_27343/m.49197 type:complete len:270 (-) Transcript_27343:469-1278(-)
MGDLDKMRKDDSMEHLFHSIREQTSRLKRNLSEHREELTPASPAPRSLPGSAISRFTPSPDRVDLHCSKALIESLVWDNKAYHEDLDDFKRVLEMSVKKCRELQKELQMERLKTSRLEFLEQQLSRERSKSQRLLNVNLRLKERYLNLLEVLRQSAFEMNEQDKDDQLTLETLTRENQHLRELLGISRLSSAKIEQAELMLAAEEEKLQPSIEDYKETLKSYRQKRQQQTRSKSCVAPGEKAYLLEAAAPVKQSQGDFWAAFFSQGSSK